MFGSEGVSPVSRLIYELETNVPSSPLHIRLSFSLVAEGLTPCYPSLSLVLRGKSSFLGNVPHDTSNPSSCMEQ